MSGSHGTLTGKVVAQDGAFFVIETNAAAPHLKSLNLVQSQMGTAKLGDTVTLTYTAYPSRGFWHVTEIVTAPAAAAADTVEMPVCSTCDGTGEVEDDDEDSTANMVECPDCEGNGYIE